MREKLHAWEKPRRVWENIDSVHYDLRKGRAELYRKDELVAEVRTPIMRAIDVRDIEIDIKGHPGKEPGIDMTFTPSATCFESERWRLYCYVPEKLLGEIESIMRRLKAHGSE